MSNIRIYVAGPITKGDQFANVRAAVDAANQLADLGFFPFVPHLFAHWHIIHPRHYEAWMALDFEYLSVCHALLRLPGESAGADREVAFARERGIPVFTSVIDLQMNFTVAA